MIYSSFSIRYTFEILGHLNTLEGTAQLLSLSLGSALEGDFLVTFHIKRAVENRSSYTEFSQLSSCGTVLEEYGLYYRNTITIFNLYFNMKVSISFYKNKYSLFIILCATNSFSKITCLNYLFAETSGGVC